MTVRVKICGVTCVEDAEAAILAGADLIGLNFYRPSPRYLDRASARAMRQVIGHRAQVVGVFVNEARSVIEQCAQELGLDMLQFHGDEEESAADSRVHSKSSSNSIFQESSFLAG